MKKYFIVFTLLLCKNIYCQNPEIKTDLPTIIPPSPTVAALMKFEEVPVSNYTGVPDISIPLFSSTTRSKDINLDISLKYHSGVGANDVAGDVGLGWSLFAGGTISRTVRGLPDEMLNLSNNNYKAGVYHSAVAGNGLSFNYYDFVETINSVISTESQQYLIDDFLWESKMKGKFDTEHDLWQFNFMGKTGRFFIKRNTTTNQLEVVPLDDYRIKIKNTYLTTTNNSIPIFTPLSFTIYDENGYKYVFDEIEETNTSTSISKDWGVIGIAPEGTYATNQLRYKSAFRLTKIFDNNDILLVDLKYYEACIESYSHINHIRNLRDSGIDSEILGVLPCNVCPEGGIANIKKLEPAFEVDSNLRITKTKKIKNINVTGIAKIDFFYDKGRLDTNLSLNDSARVFKGIIIKNWNNTIIKKYKLEYSYSQVIDKRLTLTKLIATDDNESKSEIHEFSYKENDALDNYIGKDYWGYFNLFPKCAITYEKRLEPSSNYSTTDILQKIKYPSGGCAIFNFESNQYSYIGDQQVTDFNNNKDNFVLNSSQIYYFTNSTPVLLPTSNQKRFIKLYPSIHEEEDQTMNWRNFFLSKLVNGQWIPISATLSCPYTTQNCCIELVLDAGVQYRLFRGVFNNLNVPSIIDSILIEYYTNTPILKEFLYGGGNRINKIGYFTQEVSKDYYQNFGNSNFLPSKEKIYNYNFFGEQNKSSGSLVFGKPIYSYVPEEQSCFNCGNYIISAITSKESDYNYLSEIKTQGSEVGYKNVSVFETNNGSTEYVYKSPIDVPQTDISESGPPNYLTPENLDYKRGLLETETYKDQTGKKIKIINYQYNTEDNSFSFMTGFKISKTKYINPNFKNYIQYHDLIDYCPSHPTFNCIIFEGVQLNPDYPTCPCRCFNGIVPNILYHIQMFEKYGWAKLTSKTTKNYFYTNISTTPNILETNETYDYNPINKKISESTVTNSLGDVLKTKYFYHSGNSLFSQNRISEIEKYKGTELLSTSKINYANNWSGNVSFLPQSIVTSKGSNTLESKIKYNKYDEYSNPLEVQQDSGVITSYIYGYNKTQPVAKLENIAYNSIPAALITAIQTVTDSATSTEAQVIAALNALRSSTDANMVKAMITTYTYIPLVGVSTITDPKRDTQTFSYDSFGRLQNVKDKNANILSENEYHYRP